MKKLLILALLAIIAPKVATAASWFNWQEVAGVASGIITDTAHWSSDPAGSTSPDDYLQFSLAAEYTVTIPQGSA